jgi:hypothetical protein
MEVAIMAVLSDPGGGGGAEKGGLLYLFVYVKKDEESLPYSTGFSDQRPNS